MINTQKTIYQEIFYGLNHRYYNGKLIESFYWDGKTDYNKSQEDAQTQEKRIEEFGQWLEN
jgi:hypothetical protein